MLTTILEIIMGFLKAIPIFDKWFTKSPTEKADDQAKDVEDEKREFEDTGRPKWN